MSIHGVILLAALFTSSAAMSESAMADRPESARDTLDWAQSVSNTVTDPGLPPPVIRKLGTLEDEQLEYIEVLRKETIEEGAFNLYNIREIFTLHFPSTPEMFWGGGSESPFQIHRLLYTRRMAKLVYEVLEADSARLESEIVPQLIRALERLVQARRDIDSERTRLFAEFTNETMEEGKVWRSEEARREWSRLSANPGIPPGRVWDPYPLSATVVADTIPRVAFLLGLTGNLRALPVLVEICDLSKGMFLESALQWPGFVSLPALTEYGGKVNIGDAIDRILVANAGRDDLDAPARALLAEYMAWRAERQLPERIRIPVYPFDQVRRPYMLTTALTGSKVDAAPLEVEAPLASGFGERANGLYLESCEGEMWPPMVVSGASEPNYVIPEEQEDPMVGLTRADLRYIVETARRLGELVSEQ